MSGRTVLLELSEEQAKWIDGRVAAGDYPDAKALVNDAIDAKLLDDVIGGEPYIDDDTLRRAVAPVLESIKDGTATFYSAEQVFEHLDRCAAAWAAQGGGIDEGWVRESVVPALDRMRADPSAGFTLPEARTELDRRRESRTSKS